MALIETLITGMGTAIAKGILKLWFKDNILALETSCSLTDFLGHKIKDLRTQRAIERQFGAIVEHAADSIKLMLDKEAKNIPEAKVEFIANAAASTIEETKLSAEILAKKNLDPELLANYYLNRSGEEGGNPGLAKSTDELERELYYLLLSHAAQIIVDSASQFPSFSEKVLGELLSRQDALLHISKRVMEGVNQILQAQSKGNLVDEHFEFQYRRAVIRRLDQLELFGVELEECNKRYKLSVAYVTLNIEGKFTQENDSTELNEEILLERQSISVNDALSSTTRLLVRGPAGSGKTTLIQWIAVFSAGNELKNQLEPLNDCIPFLIKLRDFSDCPLPTPEDFPRLVTTACGGKPNNWVHRVLEEGRATILIDGIDEAPENKRSEIKAWLNDLLDQYPKPRYIVTSRPHAVEEGWLDAEHFTDASLQEMERKDIQTFIDHWHAAVLEGLADDDHIEKKNGLVALAVSLKQKIQLNPAIFKLANSPLLCAMLCALHRDRVENLPGDRIELYRSCIEMFFRRDTERKVAMVDYIELSDRQKLVFLQDFAWWMIRNGKSSVSLEEAVEQFEISLSDLTEKPNNPTGENVCRLFVERVGILRQYASEKIDFPHRTFQEYLAASKAALVNDTGILLEHAHEDQWREVAILASGFLPPERAKKFIETLIDKGDKESNHKLTLFLIAAAALKTVIKLPDNLIVSREVSKRLEQFVPPETITDGKELAAAGELVTPLLKYNRRWKANQCAAAIRTLAMIDTDLAFDLLCGYLGDTRTTIIKQIEIALEIINQEHFSKFHEIANTQINYQIRGSSDTIRLYNCPFITNLDSLTIHETTHRLKIEKCHKLVDIKRLKKSNSIISIEFQDCSQLKDISSTSTISSLRELICINCEKLSDIGDLKECILLSIIVILGSRKLKNISGIENCKQLKELYLSDYSEQEDLNILDGFNHLTSLHLENCRVLKDISAIKSFDNIQSLELFHCTQLKDLNALQDSNNLQVLKITNCEELNDLAAIESCKSLQVIKLSGCKQLTDLNILRGSKCLRSLMISECEKLSDISALENCESLQTLELSGCKRLTNLTPLKSCKQLKLIKLFDCEKLYSLIDIAKLDSLESLSIKGSVELTNLNPLAACSRLKSISVYNCNRLFNINELSTITSLESLSIIDCEHLDLSNILEIEQSEQNEFIYFEKMNKVFPYLKEFKVGFQNNFTTYSRSK